MPTRALSVLALALAASGCTDSLGIGSSCAAEMREVRLREGRPPDSRQSNELAGNFTERWYFYAQSGVARIYTFRWGVSHPSCEVQGP